MNFNFNYINSLLLKWPGKTFRHLRNLTRYTTITSLLASILIMASFNACMLPADNANEEDVLVAKVFNKSLFKSELNELIGPTASPEDSSKIANAYIEKWVRESVLMHEAEKYVPNDLNIDELVRDYRASLIRHNYEKLLVENNPDSLINETELNAYYEKNKEQYKLEQPIVKCYFLKVPKPAQDWREVKKWWKSDSEEDYKKLIDYANRNAAVYMLSDSVWHNLDYISQYLPKGKLTERNYKSNKNLSTDDGEFEYLLKIIDTTPSGEYAPLELVQDQATKVILHKRKVQLLEDKKEEMYERETRNNNVKVY